MSSTFSPPSNASTNSVAGRFHPRQKYPSPASAATPPTPSPTRTVRRETSRVFRWAPATVRRSRRHSPRSCASSAADAYRRPGSLARHLRQMASRSKRRLACPTESRGGGRLRTISSVTRRLQGRQRPLLEPLRQVAAFQQLHREKRLTVVVARIVDFDDVGMRDPGPRFAFGPETEVLQQVGGMAEAQHFQGDQTVEPELHR